MHRNSVTRGLASKPEDWRWSSLRHAISSSSLSDEVNRQSYFSKDRKSSPSVGLFRDPPTADNLNTALLPRAKPALHISDPTGVLTVTCLVCQKTWRRAGRPPYQPLQTPWSPALPQRTPTGCEYPGSVAILRKPRWFPLSPLLPSHR
jgi:hypothetical protein